MDVRGRKGLINPLLKFSILNQLATAMRCAAWLIHFNSTWLREALQNQCLIDCCPTCGAGVPTLRDLTTNNPKIILAIFHDGVAEQIIPLVAVKVHFGFYWTAVLAFWVKASLNYVGLVQSRENVKRRKHGFCSTIFTFTNWSH